MSAPRRNLDFVILAVQSLAETKGSSVNSVYKYVDSASAPVPSKRISAMTKNEVARSLIRGSKLGLLSLKYGRFLCTDPDLVQKYRQAKSEKDRQEARRQRRKSKSGRKRSSSKAKNQPQSARRYRVKSKAGRKKK